MFPFYALRFLVFVSLYIMFLYIMWWVLGLSGDSIVIIRSAVADLSG